MDHTPKHIRRALRELAGRAYEVELGRALTALQSSFDRWGRGEIDTFSLSEEIHRFHQGPARGLYACYVAGHPRAAVAQAIASGVLDRAQVAPDVLDDLAGALSVYETPNPAQ